MSVAAIASGVKGSRFTARTTKTSRSSGDKFKSTLACVNVLGRASSTLKPMATTLEVCFNPVGIAWVYPEVLYILLPIVLLISTPVVRCGMGYPVPNTSSTLFSRVTYISSNGLGPNMRCFECMGLMRTEYFPGYICKRCVDCGHCSYPVKIPEAIR